MKPALITAIVIVAGLYVLDVLAEVHQHDRIVLLERRVAALEEQLKKNENPHQ